MSFYTDLARNIDTHHALGQTPILWSDPGMGKTTFVTKTLAGRESVHYPGDEAPTPVAHSQVIIPAAMDTGDLLGIPTIEQLRTHASTTAGSPSAYNHAVMHNTEDSTVPDNDGFYHMRATEFATPAWALEANSYAPYGVSYVLVDEFPAADMRVHAIFLNIIEDKRLPNGYKLHPNVKFVLAGNMNRSGVRGMTELTSAMTSRLAHYDMEPDVEAWLEGLRTNFDTAADYTPNLPTDIEESRIRARAHVGAFLDAYPTYFNAGTDTKVDRTRGWYNPRTWDRVIDVLAVTEDLDMPQRMNMVEALIGTDVRVKLGSFLNDLRLPALKDIIANPAILEPLPPAAAYTAISILFQSALAHADTQVKELAESTGKTPETVRAMDIVPNRSSVLWDELIAVVNKIPTKFDNTVTAMLVSHYSSIAKHTGSLSQSGNGQDHKLDERFKDQQFNLSTLLRDIN